MNSSMLYTVGTAINRAQENGLEVSILIDGHWLEGNVVASDGMGVMLEGKAGDHAVVKTDRIAAVNVRSSSPFHSSITNGTNDVFEEAMPMPAPRAGSE